MKNISISITIIIGILQIFTSCEQDNNLDVETDIPIVEAFLISGKPIDSIKLTKLIPYTTDETDNDLQTINDAEITIINNDIRYNLLAYPDNKGLYYCEDNDFLIKENETYYIEFQYNNKPVSASSIVPEKTTNFKISQEIIYIERTVSGSRPNMSNETYEITWDNNDGSNYYLSIDLIETVINPVNDMFTDTITQTLNSPSVTDVYNINSRTLRYFGNYRVVLYKINEEYANLYESTSTNSQSLTDSFTNIENGKGIFTAFNTDTLFFEVREK